MSVSPEDLPAVEEVPTPSRPKWVVWAAGVGVVALVAVGFFGARAISGKSNSTTAAGATPTTVGNGSFPGNGARRGRGGAITAINGTTLTIKDAATNTEVKVNTSGSTRVMVSKTIKVDDIAVGDRILATGTASGATVAAARIADMGSTSPNGNGANGFGGANGQGPNGSVPPGGRRFGGGSGANGASGAGADRGFAVGTVDSISSGTIVVSTPGGTKTTVTTSPSTTVTKSVTGTLGDLKVGDTVRVGGATAADGSVTATTINEGAGGLGGFGGGFGGFRRSGNGTPPSTSVGG